MNQSILTVLTEADTHDLTTLETIKDEMGVTDNASDARLKRWISETSGFIRTYCNRTFAAEQVSELWRAPGGWCEFRGYDRREGKIQLRRYPVTSIDSISEDDGTALTTDDYEIDTEHGWLWRMSGQVAGGGGNRCQWTASKLLVTYTAGYALLDSVPYPVEQACQLLIKHRWAARKRDPQLRAQTVPGVLEQQWWVPGAGADGLPPEVCELLDPFREVNV